MVGRLLAGQGDGQARGSGPGRPADPMDVVLAVLRDVVIDDHLQVVDVEAARGDVRGHEEREASGHEVVDDLEPFALGQVAAEELGPVAVGLELFRDHEGGMLHVGEDQGVLGGALLEQAEQEVELDVAADLVELLGDRVHGQLFRRDLDERGRVEVGLGHPAGKLVQRRAEEHALAVPAVGHLSDDIPKVGQEAHVEEAVGLVDDQKAAFLEVQALLFGQVEEASRRADDDVRAGLDLGQLHGVADAAVETADMEPQGSVEKPGFALDLDGQLSRRDDDQGPPGPFPASPEEVGEKGDQEGGCLPRACLGLDGHVLAAQGLAQGQLLDGSELRVASIRDGLLEPGIEVEFRKTHGLSLSDEGSAPGGIWPQGMISRVGGSFRFVSVLCSNQSVILP
jgi:hypothetical protein